MKERYIDVFEIERFTEKLTNVQEDISRNYQNYNDALQMLFDEGIIRGSVETKLTDAYYQMVDAKKEFEEKLDEFILYVKREIVEKSVETDQRASTIIHKNIETLKEEANYDRSHSS